MTNSLHSASHPIWSIVRLAVLMGALIVVLYLTATKFDQTEIKTIIYTFFAAAGGEGAITAIKAVLNSRGNNCPVDHGRDRPRDRADSTLVE